jgi:hypothetical protein
MQAKMLKHYNKQLSTRESFQEKELNSRTTRTQTRGEEMQLLLNVQSCSCVVLGSLSFD